MRKCRALKKLVLELFARGAYKKHGKGAEKQKPPRTAMPPKSTSRPKVQTTTIKTFTNGSKHISDL